VHDRDGTRRYISDDNGDTWRRCRTPAPGGVEPPVVELADGTVKMFIRDRIHAIAQPVRRIGQETVEQLALLADGQQKCVQVTIKPEIILTPWR